MYNFVRLERLYVQTRTVELDLDKFDWDINEAEVDMSEEYHMEWYEVEDTFIYETKEIMWKLNVESSIWFFDDVDNEKILVENIKYFLSGYEDLDNKKDNV